MRAQRRPAVTATLVHVTADTLGDADATTSTVIMGALFEPEPPSPQDIDQAHPTYLQGAFNLPGVYTAAAGDTLVVDGTEWRVLDPGTVWGTRTRVRVAAGTLPDVVALRVPGGTGPAWNPATNRTETTQNLPFAANVPSRITAIGGSPGGEPAVVDDTVTVTGYRVAIPLTGVAGVDGIVVDGETNTLVDVVSSPDPLLVGKTLRVVDVVRGSHRPERILLCTLID